MKKTPDCCWGMPRHTMPHAVLVEMKFGTHSGPPPSIHNLALYTAETMRKARPMVSPSKLQDKGKPGAKKMKKKKSSSTNEFRLIMRVRQT